MPRYRDADGDSGIYAYEIGPDWIEVEFSQGTTRFYRYTYASAGSGHVETMKRLAAQGDGLNAFIRAYVRSAFASKR